VNPRGLTPALTPTRSQLATSCGPNRGPAKASIILVNHRIATDPIPLPSNADKVNAFRPLMRRLGECRRLRRHIVRSSLW
jgi:hypothetical protein